MATVNEHRWPPLAVVTGGLLLALGFSSVGWARGLPERPSTLTSATGVGFLSFDVCGGVCRHGEVAATARDVANRAGRRGVGVVLLRELCYSQFRRVRVLLAERGFSGRFEAQTNSPACASDDARHGTGLGVAVLVRGHLARGVADQLPAGFTGLGETPTRNPVIGVVLTRGAG